MNIKKPYQLSIQKIETNDIFDWSYSEKDQDLLFLINSTGGDLHTATNLLKRMLLEKRHITTKCLGNAQSAGFIIFCGGDERIANAEDMFLFHSGVWSGNNTLFSILKYIEISILSYDMFCHRLAKISNKSYKEWFNMLKTEKDYYFSGKEMKKMGIVTKLL